MSEELKILGKTVKQLRQEGFEINKPEDVSAVAERMRLQKNSDLMEKGVIFIAPATSYIAYDVEIGEGTIILPNVVIDENCKIGKNCQIGPFAYIRPNSTIGDNVKIGDFVEIKNSTIGNGTKAAHLTYIGDADVGEKVNFGCGTVVVNYDGRTKTRTTIGDNVFVGCNTNLVSPVTIGDGAYTAAGSTITSDVPPENLAIARARQVNKANWKDRRKP